ncbi:MAG: sulfatase-like hydrolase/transferase [Acidobacteria bacterium]|nr:sulfatase-like hydrolase/transferase [Acidobacteriota bacterium]
MRFLRLALLLLLTSAAAPAQRPHDVFLITLDTLRADRVGCYGYAKAQTPALDRLARDGIRFARAFTPSPITNTSHTSILTGLNPSAHGVTDFGVPLGTAHATLAQVLKRHGYSTGAFIGAVILDSNSLAPGLDRGFDFYFNFPEDLPRSAPRWGRVERRGMDVVNEATRWLSAQRAGPRFAWVHLYDPHDPYEAPAPFTNSQSPYDGEVAYTDHAVAQFLSFLEKRGLYRDALIIAVGDHGEGLGEHGEDTHGIFVYDSTLRVPFLVKLPGGAQAGAISEVTVRTTDILPTVLDVLGLPAIEGREGRSLRSSAASQAPAEDLALAETDYPIRFGWAPLRAARSGGFKYIEAPRPEFYDLTQDPDETRNRYEPWNPEVQKLRGILAEARGRAPQKPAPTGSVDPQTIEHLRQLGYLGTDPGVTTVPEPSLLPDPKDKIALHNFIHRGMMADEGGEAAAARAAFSRAVEMDPDSAVANVQLGRLEVEQGDYASAARHLARARQLRAQDSAAAWYHGQALEKLGDFEGARAALEESLRLSPGQYEARLLLGRVLVRLKNAHAAEDQLEAAALFKPKRSEAHVELARLYLEEKRAADALEHLQKASAADPEDAAIFELLAQAYRALGKPLEARRAAARGAALKAKKKAP